MITLKLFYQDKSREEKYEPLLKSKMFELPPIAQNLLNEKDQRIRQLEEENQDLRAELKFKAEYTAREENTQHRKLEAGLSDKGTERAGMRPYYVFLLCVSTDGHHNGRLAESDEVGVGPTVGAIKRTASVSSLGKRGHDSVVGFDNSEREEKRSRHGHAAGNDGGTPTRGRSRYKKTMDRISRAASFMPYSKRSTAKAQQPHYDSSGRREIPIHDSPPSMIFPTPPASIGYASSKNTSRASGSSGNADDEASLDDRGKHMASARPLSPSEESKTTRLFRNFAGRSLSRGPSPSPVYREPTLPETPTRPKPQRPAMLGAASVPVPASRGLLSPPSTGPRRQTSPLLSSQGSSSKKRKQEDAQVYTIPDVNVESWFGGDPVPRAAVSASKRRKND